MIFKHWDILVVDDEPDVLAITEMALRRLSLYGAPVKLAMRASKAEAIEYFRSDESKHAAAALIDVVMESERSGLELCEYIRENLDNRLLPLILRTGQAGIAPEVEVIDRYEISGYLDKVSASKQRLYSIMKASIRGWYYSYIAQGLDGIMRGNLEAAAVALRESAADAVMDGFLERAGLAIGQSEHWQACYQHSCILIDGGQGGYLGFGDFETQSAGCDAAASLGTSSGDPWQHASGLTVFRVEGEPRIEWLFRAEAAPPPVVVPARTHMLRAFGNLWRLVNGVQTRNRAVVAARRETTDILENIGQGILTIDEKMTIGSEYSRHAEAIFGKSSLGGLGLLDLLRSEQVTQEDLDDLAESVKLAFDTPAMDWKKAKRITQASYSLRRDDGSTADILLDIEPIRDNEQVRKLMVLVQDISERRELERALEEQEREASENIEHLADLARLDPEVYEAIFHEGFETIKHAKDALATLSQVKSPTEVIDRMFRDMHTLKGNAMSFGMLRIAAKAHWVEDAFLDLRDSGADISGEMIFATLQRVTDLGVLFERIHKMAASVLQLERPPETKPKARIGIESERIDQLLAWVESNMTDSLRVGELLVKIRALTLKPLGELHERLDKTVQDVAEALGKLAQPLALSGGEIAVHPLVFGKLSDALLHLIRNAVDHGLETPETRVIEGKPGKGCVSVAIRQEEGRLIVEVSDDGAGIDPATLLRRAKAQRIVAEDANPDEQECLELIFNPWFSTAVRVTQTS
jgi:PAS domain S-box-containing protein